MSHKIYCSPHMKHSADKYYLKMITQYEFYDFCSTCLHFSGVLPGNAPAANVYF